MNREKSVRVAVLDMNDGTKNLGVPAIVGILEEASFNPDMPRFEPSVFDVRAKNEIPGLEFDMYISSGGPGSPFAGQGTRWEADYFGWLDKLWSYNVAAKRPKHGLFICHSFEMMCHFFGLADVTPRRSPSFGIFPVHLEEDGIADPVFHQMERRFWAADFRSWQVINPSADRMSALDASVLAREKIRPHVPLERAIMSIRVGRSLVGVQFHPEAAPDGMRRHFKNPKKRLSVIEEHGEARYREMLALLREPSPLEATRRLVIPNFLDQAVRMERSDVYQSHAPAPRQQ